MRDAPAFFRARAAALAVAPVVITSSINKTALPAMRLSCPGGTKKAPATLRWRSVRDNPTCWRVRLVRTRASGAIGQGEGEKAGTAYRMKDGSMVYVPEGTQ